MKIIILDPYKKSNSKINKDQAGGYGTSNEFGDNFLPFAYGQISFPIQTAVRYKIPLIFFGDLPTLIFNKLRQREHAGK